MKKIITSISTLALAILIGCGNNNAKVDNNVSEETNSTGKNNISCTINGKAWQSSILQTQASNKYMIVIVGNNKAESNIVGISFNRAKAKVGMVFNFDPTTKFGEWEKAGVFLRKIDAEGNVIEYEKTEALSGTVSITKVGNDFIEGTFSATGVNYTISNGKFAINMALQW